MASVPAVKNDYAFGAATRAINGYLECTPTGNAIGKARKRYRLYVNVLQAFNLKITPNESGCY